MSVKSGAASRCQQRFQHTLNSLLLTFEVEAGIIELVISEPFRTLIFFEARGSLGSLGVAVSVLSSLLKVPAGQQPPPPPGVSGHSERSILRESSANALLGPRKAARKELHFSAVRSEHPRTGAGETFPVRATIFARCAQCLRILRTVTLARKLFRQKTLAPKCVSLTNVFPSFPK